MKSGCHSAIPLKSVCVCACVCKAFSNISETFNVAISQQGILQKDEYSRPLTYLHGMNMQLVYKSNNGL